MNECVKKLDGMFALVWFALLLAIIYIYCFFKLLVPESIDMTTNQVIEDRSITINSDNNNSTIKCGFIKIGEKK